MSFNTGGKISARVGNWVEEEQLLALTGQTRYEQPDSTSRKSKKPMSHTAARVIAHSDAQDPSDWRSSTRSGHTDPNKHQPKKKNKSRAEMRAAKIRAEVEAQLSREGKRAEAKANRGRWETTSQSTFVEPVGFGKIGSRSMKTQSGNAPRNQDEQTYEFGLHARKPTMSKEALAGELGDKYYLNDMPISVYTQRMNDGSMPNSGITNAGNPFSRSAAFTNDIMDSTKAHAEGMDDPTGQVHGSGKILTEAPGGGLSVRGVVQRVLKAITKDGGNGMKTLARIFNEYDSSGDKQLDREELRNGLQKNGVRLSMTDLDQIFAHFDHDRSGTISFDEFMRGVRGSMSERRTALVNSAFTILDKSGAGTATIDEVAESYDATCDPKVMSGEATPDQALNTFLRNFGRRVSKAQFVDYYRDISAGVDRDDYFELMMEQRWHISEAEADNGVMVVDLVMQGGKTQSVELKNSQGLRKGDFDKIRARLHKQGVHGVVKMTNSGGQMKEWAK